MPLSVAEHQVVKAHTRQLRNAGARAKRGGFSSRLADVRLYAVELDGAAALLAVSAADPHRPYLLRRNERGGWACGCFAAQYSVRRTCSHLEAAQAWERGGGGACGAGAGAARVRE